jgi:hypothetical protein
MRAESLSSVGDAKLEPANPQLVELDTRRSPTLIRRDPGHDSGQARGHRVREAPAPQRTQNWSSSVPYWLLY